MEAVLWTDGELEDFMQLVYRIKAGERDADIGAGIKRLAASLGASGST